MLMRLALIFKSGWHIHKESKQSNSGIRQRNCRTSLQVIYTIQIVLYSF